ncbi:MAG: PTS fructose transporter subunit IIA [Desulfuromonas sp.]|nr:MAG: PTS fructose transporter subunit IIA [Desulfuromonas sp.]
MNLSVKDAARILSVTEKTIYRWIKQDLIPAYRVNGQHRFNQSELIEWATSRRMGLSPDAYLQPGEEAVPLPRLSEAIEAGGIIYRLGGKTRNEVLAALVDQLRLSEGVDKDYLLKVLIAREELASTSVGDGIAIPHPRNPVLLHSTRPKVTLAFLEKPVDFRSLDGIPTRILFCVISPTLRAHLHLLSLLGYALNNQKFRNAIEQTENRESILKALSQVKKGLVHENRPRP